MKKILVLGRNSRSTRLLLTVLYNYGYKTFYIEECRDDKKLLLKKRILRFGVFVLLSQLLFMLFAALQSRSKKVAIRLKEIESSVVPRLIDVKALKIFENVNDPKSIEFIKEVAPDFIILSGTRILSTDFLHQFQCPIINIHAGINPSYRGVHGGYWALVNQQIELFGSTIHFVDEGVDTGGILYHAKIKPCASDNFSTYPLLQMSAALMRLPTILKNISDEKQNTFIPELKSKIWTHPTIWQYILFRINFGIR